MQPHYIGDLSQKCHGVEEHEAGPQDEGLHPNQKAEGHEVQEGPVDEPGRHLGEAGEGADPESDESVVICKWCLIE